MGRDSREVIALSNALKINSKNTKEIIGRLLIYLNNNQTYTVNRIAGTLSKEINKAFKERDKDRLIKALIKKENVYAANNKKEIIELYLGNETSKGLGYVNIKKVLLASCEHEEERKRVISESTISKYLHVIWGVPKDRTRNIPLAAANARKKQSILS